MGYDDHGISERARERRSGPGPRLSWRSRANARLRAVLASLLALALLAAGAGFARADDPSPVPSAPSADEVNDLPQSQHKPADGVELPDTYDSTLPIYGVTGWNPVGAGANTLGAPVPLNTPYAKDGSAIWRQQGGAEFPQKEGDDPTALVKNSPTTYDDNLYDVAFPASNTQLGIAGGSHCEDSNPDAEKGCKPVAFVYTDTPETGKVWERKDFDGPGFIAAIAWMGPNTALAVGGTGAYPRREPAAGKP
ncbi:MAG: hypothetical protein QOG26_1241, partial [Solirubrobacterales bacterium]|nr:hypothetical protein [Solirubrobacterales bacterium]